MNNVTKPLTNYLLIKQRIEHLSNSAKLIVVTKGQNSEQILPLLAAGARIFAENKIQEAISKWPELKLNYPDLQLHFIGHLQSNKIAEALEYFDLIQSVGTIELAEKIAALAQKMNKGPKIYLQVNIGEEPQKDGFAPEEIDSYVKICRQELGLDLCGLMAIPPANLPAFPYFALTAQIAKRNQLENISMGMSNDFKSAIEFGATEVRIGRGIFES